MLHQLPTSLGGDFCPVGQQAAATPDQGVIRVYQGLSTSEVTSKTPIMSISIVKLLRSLAEEIDLEDNPKHLQAGTGKYQQCATQASFLV